MEIVSFRCGYCGDEIYTRYAATYHIKYKHAGMPRNFIQNKADISQYYVNRAKEEEEKNQFKVVETRRVRVPTQTKSDRSVQSKPNPIVPTVESQSSVDTSTSALPDYRFLLTWSYYLAAQVASQQGQSPPTFPTDPNIATKFLQAMQTVINPPTRQSSNSKQETKN